MDKQRKLIDFICRRCLAILLITLFYLNQLSFYTHIGNILFKINCTCCYHICFNGSNSSSPKLHNVASTWYSSVELHIQWMLMGIAADLGLTIYGGEITDAYAHFPAQNSNLLGHLWSLC